MSWRVRTQSHAASPAEASPTERSPARLYLTEATVKNHLAHIYTLASASATVPKPSSTPTKLACLEHPPTGLPEIQGGQGTRSYQQDASAWPVGSRPSFPVGPITATV